jgi:hypothetical protein
MMPIFARLGLCMCVCYVSILLIKTPTMATTYISTNYDAARSNIITIYPFFKFLPAAIDISRISLYLGICYIITGFFLIYNKYFLPYLFYLPSCLFMLFINFPFPYSDYFNYKIRVELIITAFIISLFLSQDSEDIAPLNTTPDSQNIKKEPTTQEPQKTAKE